MSLLDRIAPAPRKIMTLFYLIDTSDGMRGEKMGSVNSALEEAIAMDLPDFAAVNDAAIQAAVMRFSSGCSWTVPKPLPLEDITWSDLIAGGRSDLGAAFRELNARLSTAEFLQSETGLYAPVILLFSSSRPTDDWEAGLKLLKANDWFKCAIKIAVTIGDDADPDILSAFTGTPESVIRVNDKRTLKDLIRKIDVPSELQN